MANQAKRPRATQAAKFAGYSGKSLAAKLGLKAGLRVYLEAPVDHYWDVCGIDPECLVVRASLRGPLDLVHGFFSSREQLLARLPKLAKAITADGMLWLSWPKKSSTLHSDLDENELRAIALPLGLVDVKVCAVDATWSALKLVWRRELRSGLHGRQ